MVGPFDRAGWRAWLIANHATSSGVHLVSWRRGSGQTSVGYEEAVEEALCVGWIDSSAGKSTTSGRAPWFSRRKPGSGWARTNKERVVRLRGRADDAAGLATIDAAERRLWTRLDASRPLSCRTTSRRRWPPIRRRPSISTRSPVGPASPLDWIAHAKRPETRANRIAEAAEHAARNEVPPRFRPRD